MNRSTRLATIAFAGVTVLSAFASADAVSNNGPVCPPGCVPAHRTSPNAARMRARAARERAAAEQADRDRLAAEQTERDRMAAQQADRDRMAREQAERDRLAAEQAAAQATPAPVAEPVAAPMPAPMPVRATGGGPEPRRMFMLGIEGGVGAFEEGALNFDSGTGHATTAGPSWGVRAGINATPWLGFEARYMAMWNNGRSTVTGADAGLVVNAGAAVVRLQAPTPFVQPYVLAGAGVYGTNVTGSDASRQASSFTNDVSFGIPVGVGVEIPIGHTFSVGAEGTYHHLFGESFSSREDLAGADLMTGNAVLRIHL